MIPGDSPVQRLDETTEKVYSINFTEQQRKLGLSFYYNESNSYVFVNGSEIFKFKAKDFEINPAPLCLGNISIDFSVDNIKKTGLYGYVYDFLHNYNNAGVDYILDIHKYLIEQPNTK